MAPLSRGPKARYGAGPRGRGSARRGRGGGGKNLQSREKSAFSSTRIDEPDVTSSNESEDLAVQGQGQSETGSDDVSSEEDASSSNVLIKPYNALLQSLNGNTSGTQQPLRKKRRISQGVRQENDQKIFQSSRRGSDADEDVDLIEEVEEVGDYPVGETAEIDSEEENVIASDPFEIHFASPDEETIASKIAQAKASGWKSDQTVLPSGWKLTSLNVPSEFSKTSSGVKITDHQDIRSLQLKHRLEGPAERCLLPFSNLTAMLAPMIFNYQDILFSERTSKVSQDLRELICLHTLNHIFKTRDKIIKNNTRAANESQSEDREYRDQGFTRPKVLIILPTRQSCVQMVDTIMSFCEPEQQENKKRFQDSYVQTEDQFSFDKPEDFRELFAGNDDDMFRLGIKLTRKTVKYFSQFYNSDIILASPLGLKMAIGAEDAKKQDRDFLSSIEIVIVDQTDALLMQNWEHVEYAFRNLNLQPKETHGCDFSRVRNWYLDGDARYLRQTIILSAFNAPEINRMFLHYLHNIAGRVKVSKESYEGVMIDMALQLKQTFSRYDAPKPIDDPDTRFNYFTTSVVPSLIKLSILNRSSDKGVLIFIPSYMDFVRIRNFLATSSTTQNVSFGAVSEYTSVRDVARARSHFVSGRHSILLYTGRAHHFRRYHLRGVKRIVMYAMPDNPVFYQEMVEGYLGSSVTKGEVNHSEVSVRSIFSKLDALKLERIVGTRRCVTMLREKGGDTFDFL